MYRISLICLSAWELFSRKALFPLEATPTPLKNLPVTLGGTAKYWGKLHCMASTTLAVRTTA